MSRAEAVELAKSLMLRNASSKWGHPKYTCIVSSAELRSIVEWFLATVAELERAEKVETAVVNAMDRESLTLGVAVVRDLRENVKDSEFHARLAIVEEVMIRIIKESFEKSALYKAALAAAEKEG